MNEDLTPSLLCTALMRIGTRMAAVFDQHFAPMGVTQAQFRVLLAIHTQTIHAGSRDEGIAPSVLAEHLLIERATVSVLTGRLIERGLLTRQPGENRRTFRLALTKTGHTLLHDVLPHAVALADATWAGVEHTELRRALALLNTLEARLREDVPPGDAARV